MKKLDSTGNFVLSVGSTIALFFGALTAFSPGLAYITRYYMLPEDSLFFTHPIFEFSVHIFTYKLLISAAGGLIGVLSFFASQKRLYVASAGVMLGAFGLLWPAPMTIHEDNVPWIGFLITLAGVLTMFLGLAAGNSRVPRVTFLSVPLLLALNLLGSAVAISNNLQFFYILYRNIAFWILQVLGYSLIIWGTVKGMTLPRKEQVKPT